MSSTSGYYKWGLQVRKMDILYIYVNVKLTFRSTLPQINKNLHFDISLFKFDIIIYQFYI